MARHAAVLGKPISHSKSPVLHRAAYQLLAADIDYRAIELDPADAGAHASVLRSGGWTGCSVTMPLKDVFVPLMDDLSERVQRLGALNTIIVRPDGSLFGENTDVDGLVLALGDYQVAEPEHCVVLGAGNTALAAIEACAELQAQALTLIVRDASRTARAQALAAGLGFDVQIVEVGRLHDGALENADVVISTLPPRAADHWLPALGTGCGVLLDVAYDPWPSKIAENWGGTVVSGLHMLVHQAVEQARHFSGVDFDPATREAVTNAMYAAVELHRRG